MKDFKQFGYNRSISYFNSPAIPKKESIHSKGINIPDSLTTKTLQEQSKIKPSTDSKTSIQGKNIQFKDVMTDESQPWMDVVDLSLYSISSDNAIIREFKEGEFKETENKITKWTEVKITKKSNNDKYVFVQNNIDNSDIGWTSMSNLYNLTWSPTDRKSNYNTISSSYSNQMQQNNPVETIKDISLSGAGTKDLIDKYYKNSTDINDLDSAFRTKYENLKNCFEANGMTVSASAGLRHPLRSLVFNYAIKVKSASSIDDIKEANAVCKKYGIPIDWAHKDSSGNIDLKESKSKAKVVCDAFGIGSKAARGVTDFGGTISNHNSGKAVDVKITFSFDSAKEITFNNKKFIVDPVIENQSEVANISSTGLTMLGKEASGLTRNMSDDKVHWSETGN